MRILPLIVMALAVVPAVAITPAPAAAQEASVPFGGLEHDNTQPVEITSDALALDQAAGTAVFTGSVLVGQGLLRLAADRLEVFYAEEAGAIRAMHASGSVTLSNGAEAAEASEARYDVVAGIVEMEGDVLLTQGPNALSGERLRIDLTAGTGTLEGRVRTILVPGSTP
jgi:lipopolysaccharide export system protein LptA